MPDLAPVNNDAILINGVEYLVSDLSFSDLRVHYFTGVSVRRLGDQHSKSSGYRNGVMTGLGDLEFPVWETLVRDLIHRSGEDELLNSLITWLEATPWLRTKRDKELYALELHAAAYLIIPTGSITLRSIDNIAQANYKEMKTHMNQEKKALEITGLPLVPLSVGCSAYIFESDGTRRTSRVLAIQHSSQTEIDFETLNTHYLLHIREIGGRT